MPRPIIFGDVEGIEEGYWFSSRKEMMPSSFHRNHGKGIDGNGTEGTAAIVLSGGYEDDEDNGEEIIYTGEGGIDRSTNTQISDQSWDSPGNAGLLKSSDDGLPVRVIRGHTHESDWSPSTGYLYSGTYSVVDAWQERGKSGFVICRFKLLYSGENSSRRTASEVELDNSARKKQRRSHTVLRVVRDSKLSALVKNLYGHQCQVCGLSIKTKKGLYAEGAHIRPIGTPHDGDDSIPNLLCLCPNHHVMFDKGAFSLSDNLTLVGSERGKLTLHQKHIIDMNSVRYHRDIHGFS